LFGDVSRLNRLLSTHSQ